MMSFNQKILTVGESFLRVPPLLLVDEIFRISFGFGGKLLKYGAKNLVTSDTVIINSEQQGEISEDQLLPTCSALHPLISFSSNVTCDAAEQPDILSGIIAGAVTSAAEDAAALGALGTSSESLTETTSYFFRQANQEDYLLQISFGDLSSLTESVTWELARTGEIFTCVLVFFAAVIVFLLSTQNLLKLYSHLLSILAVFAVYMIVPFPISKDNFCISTFVYSLILRTVLAGLFFISRNTLSEEHQGHQKTKEGANRWSKLDSVLLVIFYLCGVVYLKPALYAVIVLLLQKPLWTCVPSTYKFLKESWNETRRVQNEYGLSHLIQVECSRLRVNTVFRLFWISRAAYDVMFQCCGESVAHILRYVMSHGTETFTGVVGLTVTVSVVCHSIGEFLLWVLYWGTNSETDANRFGSISTVLFFILSLQTGLTSLDPEKRLDRLLKNVVLLGTALFHALHQMVAPLLHAFRSFQGLQIRAVTISIAFLSISLYSTVYLLRFSAVSTWSLAVLALAIEFKIKIVISLVISIVVYLSQLVQYPECLQKISGFFRAILPYGMVRVVDKLADQLSHEDVVFYLKSVANVGEFLTGIFLFVNAVWIFMFESASAIRAIGMTIHAYFNIWCEARKGWKIYCQRKTASMKIMSLADATEEQLASRKDDVCAICYEEMESAKVTLCGHLFHAVCLRKWLYVQNTCPLCHELLYGEDFVEELNRANGGPAAAAAGVGQADEDIDDEDDMFEDYASTNLPDVLPAQIVLPQAQVVFTSSDGLSVNEIQSQSDSSTSYAASHPQQHISEDQVNQVPLATFSNDEEGPSNAAEVGRSNNVVLIQDVYVHRNNNNDVNNFNPNANPRSRGGLAVLL